MSRLYASVLSMAFVLATAVAAHASPIASFTISDGTWAVEDGNVVTITGDYAGDVSGLMSLDPNQQLPLVFGAEFSVDGNIVFAGEAGPVPLSPMELILAGFGLGGTVDDLTGGAFSAATNYVLRGFGRSNTSDVFSFGDIDLFFSWNGGPTGPTTLNGGFTAIITQTAVAPTLSELVNTTLGDLNLVGTPLDGFTFPSNASGTYGAEFTIAVVPLPASLPLLGAGLLGLALFRRRHKA